MATSNNSAVLDVVVENKEITSILKEVKDGDTLTLSANSLTNNCLIPSDSVESLTTIQDIENLSELNMDEDSDLCVKIDSPQKHLETLETYITFRITTKVARIEFPESEYVVRRRYNDFVWLRQKLVEAHPFCIIPPLPGKHSLIGQLDRYSKDFIISRMKSLNTFMIRVTRHPILSCSDHLKSFLTSTNSDFILIRRQRSNSESKLKSLPTITLPITNLKNPHLEFNDAKTYLSRLAEKLAAVEKISSRITKEQNDLLNELNNFHPVFMNWATIEPDFSKALISISKAIELNAAAQSALIHNHTSNIIEPIKDLSSYIEVVQDTLKKREHYQHSYENALEELNKKHSERDKLMSMSRSPSQNSSSGFSLWRQPSCDDKLEKLGTYIPQLLKKVETHQDSLECANESLRSDLERWQKEKQQSLKKILTDFVIKHHEYYQTGLNAWQSAMEEITSLSTKFTDTK